MNDESIALVTGANRGIGLEVCRQLARRGSVVLLSARDLAKATAAAAELSQQGGKVHGIALDVSDDTSVAAAVRWIESKFGRLDVLVNNAGGNFDMANQASTVSMDYVRVTLEMNLIGAWRVTQAMLPLLRQS